MVIYGMQINNDSLIVKQTNFTNDKLSTHTFKKTMDLVGIGGEFF